MRHVSFRIIDATKKAIEIVKAQGGTISLDPNIRKEMLRIPEMRDALRYVLEFTDIFLPNGGEYRAGGARQLGRRNRGNIPSKDSSRAFCGAR